MIKEEWLKVDERADPWISLSKKIKACKCSLQMWHKRVFKRADEESIKLKRTLNHLLNQEGADVKSIKGVQVRIKELWKQEDLFWCQRSRVKRLEGGDKNTRFFHASTIQRRGRNRIQRIQDKDGVSVEGQQQLFNLILTHFREVYSSDRPVLDPKCLDCIPRLVTTQMNDCLTRRVSSDEIKLTLDSLGAMKAAGPDGLNGLFFQKNWGTVKEDVTEKLWFSLKMAIFQVK